MSAQVAADLRAAAEVLRRDGWTQHEYGSSDGPKCFYGALHYVATDGATVDDALTGEAEIRTHRSAAVLESFVKVRSLTRWNDAPERTADEVIAALEAAAAAAEADR